MILGESNVLAFESERAFPAQKAEFADFRKALAKFRAAGVLGEFRRTLG